jgi:DNA invertase Pin-like site-specific DNA recombinase
MMCGVQRDRRQVLKVGYGRTSTFEQQAGLEAQLRDLRAVGCEKIFEEQVSSVGKRPQLDACLDFIREGDTLVITKLDRLARSTQHLLEIADLVKRKGADLHILNLNIETSTATGKLLLTMIAAVATFEREMMLERASPRQRPRENTEAGNRPHERGLRRLRR